MSSNNISNQSFYFQEDDYYEEDIHSYKWFGFLLFIVLAVFIALGVRYLMQAHSFPINMINIEGEFVYLDEDALATLASKSVSGGFFSLNVDAIRQKMQAEPWVETIMVRRIWPDTLAINVVEQTPVAQWNSVSLLNHHGEVFTPEATTIPADLPSVTAPEGTEALILEQLHNIRQQVKPLNLSLTAIHLSERRAWKLNFNELEVLVGKTEFEKRMQRFIQLVPIALNGNYTDISLVDLRYTNGFSINQKQTTQLLSDKLIMRSESSEKI